MGPQLYAEKGNFSKPQTHVSWTPRYQWNHVSNQTGLQLDWVEELSNQSSLKVSFLCTEQTRQLKTHWSFETATDT